MSSPEPENQQALFERFLVRLRAGEDVNIDGLVADHPEHEEAMRKLWHEHGKAEAAVDAAMPAGQKTSSFFGRKEAAPHTALGVSSGQIIGDFRVLEPIGQGGMGQVWEAEQLSLRRRVALKIVRPDRVTRKTLDLFAREARAGGRLSHPGIVSVYGHGESEGVAWIALEFVRGSWTLRDSLDEVVKQGELPATYSLDVAGFVAKLADALETAHAAGVIHRDLKPQNILVTPEDEPKVTDFGLARITDELSLSMTGEFAGTYYYMSPEQVAGKRIGLDHRSDVFALGVVLYEMLALRRPFEGDTVAQVGYQIMQKDPPELRSLRSRIPEDLAVIAGKCLEKDRERRYATMAALAEDLRRFLASEPIRARPPGRLRKLQLWARRNPTKSVAGAVAAVAFVAITLLLEENVRANLELTETLGERDGALGARDAAIDSLETANAQLDGERLSLAAEIESVKRLSALQDYDELIEEVDELWPPHPENIAEYETWRDEARALLSDLDLHRTKRDELRESARPQTEEEREADRRGHESFERLEQLPAEIAARRAALLQRRDGVEAELPELEWDALPVDASALNVLAWPLVDPDREIFGREGEGLTLAWRALDLAEAAADDALVATVGDTLSRALFALGRDEEALDASRMALAVAPDDYVYERAVHESYLASLEGWVAKARSAEGLAAEEEALAELEAEREELEARVVERQTWEFPETEEGRDARWWHANVTKLIGSLEGLQDERTGLLSVAEEAVSETHGWSVPRRLAFAERLRDGSAAGGEWDGRWEQATLAIREHPKYGGLELARQVGLVPIGPDPESGLWEFWHVATGAEPARDEDGKLVLAEDMGIVLVLVPGGTFWMGAQSTDPNGLNYDKRAIIDERPVHEVTLSGYFLSKYEMTQGQWKRFTGRNPSQAGPDGQWSTYWLAGGGQASLLHPVEQVNWFDCKRELERMGLSLPSEAQWEHGCRAGTETPWWTGEEQESLRGAANLADTYSRAHGAPYWKGIQEWLDDGASVHAAVGTYAANPLGLHEVHGNVWEWCLDRYNFGFYGRGPKTDPLAPWEGAALRVVRGSSFVDTAAEARSAHRSTLPPSMLSDSAGVRPARVILD